MRFRSVRHILLTAGLIAFTLLVSATYPKSNQRKSDGNNSASAPVSCVDFVNGLSASPGIKSAKSQIVSANGPAAAYCQANILYGTNVGQNINIRVGLPLSSVDGGKGGVEGAWNGRTQGIGGGGCAGNMNVAVPVMRVMSGPAPIRVTQAVTARPVSIPTAVTVYSSSTTLSATP